MDFWRSGRARPHREKPVSTVKGPRGFWKRLTNMYFPPWVPVVGIIFVVFGVLGLLFITRSATGSPRIGADHWHSTYTSYVCGEKLQNAPTWEQSGVHTHGDGVIHIHPFTASEEGSGARLVKWFQYGSGKLDGDEFRLPGFSKTWKNGDECPDGSKGEVQVFVNSQKLDDYTRYIPKDGDRIRILFGPPTDFVQLDDRTVLPEDQAVREVELTITGNENTTAFTPGSLQVKSGETVKVTLINDSEVSHGLRFAGSDGEYETGDDFVAVPEGVDPAKPEEDVGDVILPGARGFVIVRFDDAGQVEFKDPTANAPNPDPEAELEPYAIGTVIVTESGSGSPTPTPSAEAEVALAMTDGSFDPEKVTVAAGELFKITLTNTGEFVHNIRIAGPDGEFETDDDIASFDIDPGGTGEIIGQIDEAGDYDFRCDFHADETGTLTVE